MNPHPVLIDALAEARLEGLHLTGAEAGRPGPWDVEAATTAAEASLSAGLSLRLRVGRGLLALGAAIAGDDEPDRIHHAA